MKCPFCSTQDTKVIDSRLFHDGNQIKRRRECIHCQERFTTYEIAQLSLPRIIKRSGVREDFNEEKLRTGILSALQKRPVESEKVENILMEVKHALRVSGEKEVPAIFIGELVMRELRYLDEVAYVRFASVYRRFQDITEFTKEINSIIE
jgi:transcriptional repressor NrdR